MYFLIGIWGGPRREYAAIKFFLYTLLGSVLMLIAILVLYFASDLTKLDAGTLDTLNLNESVVAEVKAIQTDGDGIHAPIHTFNLLALAEIGQHTDCFSPTVQWWCFLLLFIGFLVKVPSIPVHTVVNNSNHKEHARGGNTVANHLEHGTVDAHFPIITITHDRPDTKA